jgi:DNA replicative helicase MCM subunit Mcm2 (Cdc46/Mcm family)
MFGPTVISHKDNKIEIILAATGAPENAKQKRRGRIHVLLLGTPRTDKTTLVTKPLNLLPYSAAQTSSTKTIIVIV